MNVFELPDMRDDEILAEVMTDSLCMSTLKAVDNGADHKKVPDDVATHPVILGHEFCGRILKVGAAGRISTRRGSASSSSRISAIRAAMRQAIPSRILVAMRRKSYFMRRS